MKQKIFLKKNPEAIFVLQYFVGALDLILIKLSLMSSGSPV